MNVVMTGDGRLIEVQATAERVPFSRERARRARRPRRPAGIGEIGAKQQEAVA